MSSHASIVNISAMTDSMRKLNQQPHNNQLIEQVNKQTVPLAMALTEDARTLQLALELTMVGLNNDSTLSTTSNNSTNYNIQPIIINNNQNDYDISSAFAARTEMPIINNITTGSGLLMPSSTGLEDRSKKSQNMTECVPVPSSEHVAEIVGRQGCKIKALRAKTNTYIKTPVRGEEPVFVVTGRKEDVNKAKREILSAADHFSLIRASRKPSIENSVNNGVTGSVGGAGHSGQLANIVARGNQSGPPCLPGQITIQVRVPYRVVGLVVGPKGATIKHIQQETQTYIVTPSREKEPIFEVTGLPDNVETARKQIEAHIALRTGSNSNGVGCGAQGSDNGTESLDSNEFATLHTINTLTQILNDDLNPDILSSIYKGKDNYVIDNNTPIKKIDGISNNHSLAGQSVNLNHPTIHNLVNNCYTHSDPLATTSTTTQIAETQSCSKSNTLFRNPISNGKTLTFCPPSAAVLATSSSTNVSSISASILTRSCSSASSTASTKSTNNSANSTTNSVNTPPELLNIWKSLNDAIDVDEGIGDSPSIWSLPTGATVTVASNCSPTTSISPTDSLLADHNLKISNTTNSSSVQQQIPQVQINSDKSSLHRECFVCNEKEVTTALVPCGHNMFCMDCANQICVSMESVCPICHSIVYHAMRILA